jgi:hypothetical protein
MARHGRGLAGARVAGDKEMLALAVFRDDAFAEPNAARLAVKQPGGRPAVHLSVMQAGHQQPETAEVIAIAGS